MIRETLHSATGVAVVVPTLYENTTVVNETDVSYFGVTIENLERLTSNSKYCYLPVKLECKCHQVSELNHMTVLLTEKKYIIALYERSRSICKFKVCSYVTSTGAFAFAAKNGFHGFSAHA